MRLGSALAGTFSRQVREPGGGGGGTSFAPRGPNWSGRCVPECLHERAPALLQRRRLADARGAAHQHHSVAAVPRPAYGRFGSGLAPARRVPPGAHLPETLATARGGTSRTRRINSVSASPKDSHGSDSFVGIPLAYPSTRSPTVPRPRAESLLPSSRVNGRPRAGRSPCASKGV